MKFAIVLCFVLVAVVAAEETENESEKCTEEFKAEMKKADDECPKPEQPTQAEMEKMTHDELLALYETYIECFFGKMKDNTTFKNYCSKCGITSQTDINAKTAMCAVEILKKACHNGTTPAE